MNANFAYLVEQYGKPAQAEPFGADEAQRLQGKLPESLLEFWSECGIGSWMNTKLQFCHPDRYTGIVDAIFDGDNEFTPGKTHLYGFGAFGELQLWNEDRETLSVNLPYLSAYAASSAPDWSKSDGDIALVSTLFGLEDKGNLSLFEDLPGTPPLFDKCVKAHGRLAMGECYGLFPALALGGNCKITNVRRVRALEHFALLAQLGPVKLGVATADGSRTPIRTLGGSD